MSFGAFARKFGIPWNGQKAPAQRYRYFPAIIKDGIAFLSGRVSYDGGVYGWGGWRRRGAPKSREAKRRELIAILRRDPRGVVGVTPPAHECEKAAHRARMERRLVERLAATNRHLGAKAKSHRGSFFKLRA